MAEKTFAASKKSGISSKETSRKRSLMPFFSSSHDVVMNLQRSIGNRAVVKLFQSGALQTKLDIGKPGDKYEIEADRLAEKVMKIPDTAVQRQVEEEEEDALYATLSGEKNTPQVQRQLEPEEEDAFQAKFETAAQSPTATEHGIDFGSLRGHGSPLPNSERRFFEPRFGIDFGHVRMHSGETAAKTAGTLQAKAFTMGNNIVFGRNQYAPGTTAGRNLMAHELTHVVQQGHSTIRKNSFIQRKIIVGGKQYTPTSYIYTHLKNKYPSMDELLKNMHNGGNSPDYEFSSYLQLAREILVRYNATKGMEEVNKNGCCNYGKPHRLNDTYWDKVGTTHFTVKKPLPTGKNPSDAIDSIFEAGADNRLECNSLMVAVQYRAMLKTLGPDKFNTKFPGGDGIIISPHHRPPRGVARHPIWEKKLYKSITITGESDLLPGDWVYFKNFSDYGAKHPGGVWSGEHALYMGGGKYQGFGPNTFAGGTSLTKATIEKELCDQYNAGLLSADQKDCSTIPGLQNYARRPVIEEIEKS